jgi:L-cysteine:1D-myo-inositol 2-amino-2-deoxy-alpha-D-glucopyranoside ligase
MTVGTQYPSGIIGLAGRVEHLNPAVRSAEVRLAGEALPLVSPARLYICGITPYDVTHLGHAATFVWADAAQSVLRSVGVHTVSCRNVTDVDDVLTSAAGEHGRHYDDYAVYQEFLFEQSMAALRVARPTHSPRARHSVPQVQQLAAALIATGNAYQRDGSVYFRGENAVIASGVTRDRALDLAVEFGDNPDDPARDDPFDVPVWRPSTERDPAWPSPWGWGRPGWHAECAAMAIGALGPSVDVLIGGADLAFPHHAYQTAMVQAAMSVTPFARRHMHVGAVHHHGRKMAKSTGNLVLVDELLGSHPPAAIRLLLLDRAWQTGWEYHQADLDAAAADLETLHTAAGRANRSASAAAAVTAALLNDLDVPTALAIARQDGGEAARGLLNLLALS